ncbi:hypothetical protein VHEMI01577 [[Torrubiella] hemipterigena]|uniref:Zn(2)-C6 fungal-type domain-containing protein n=1 Tax=[Torrubiella] hemipterigena TaxID=1531966 RepID=A0A0A1T5R6_9HYPO|nr:hypothetical protein VHEMI01577 [[Torrubiella] hemipterigena]
MRAIVPRTPLPSKPAFLPVRAQQKRFAPRSRSGCLACRRRRVKCREQRPACQRCVASGVVCEYPGVKGITHQPSVYIFPHGLPVSDTEINLFGSFHNDIVKIVSGPFNQIFWQVDVPTAAQAYPSLWYAAISLTAIHQSVRVRSPSNSHYMLALTYFNKSLRCLAQVLAERQGNLQYMDKEMVIMTNIIYIGICSMLKDSPQSVLHAQNLANLLEKLRFGEESPSDRRGILRYDDLLSVVLAIDGSTDITEGFQHRWEREWVVALPKYAAFSSVTEAYIGMLPYMHSGINDQAIAQNNPKALKQQIKTYAAKLDEFQYGRRFNNSNDWKSLQTIRLHLSFLNLRAEKRVEHGTAEYALLERKTNALLDEIDQVLSSNIVSSPYMGHEGIPAFSFSPALGCLLETIFDRTFIVSIRRRVISMIKKWPYREGGISSGQSAAMFDAVMQHELRGSPPVQDCTCIPHVYVCRQHTYRWYCIRNTRAGQVLMLKNAFERDHELPSTSYILEYEF